MSSPKALCKWLIVCLLVISGVKTQAQISANFSATPTDGCAPLLVMFSDASTGNPTSWKWDLGNGTISFLQNPAVTYFTPGTYNIKLVAKNSSGADSIVKSQFITVYGAPSITFNASPTSGCFPLPVQFTDNTTAGSGTISSWEWDFGDGNVSGIQNPQHTYTATGNFNVSLRVKNSFGCATTVTKPAYIQIGSGVHADFSNNVPNSCQPPATINFSNLSTGTGTLNYIWDFGDGSTSTAANPSHVYSSNGNYTVQLIVFNSGGCRDTLTKVNAVVLGNVKADFQIPGAVCLGNGLLFTNTSTPIPPSATWDYGDGTSSNSIDGSKSYASPGTYIVKMVANFGACLDSISKSITILPKPIASFTASTTGACQPPLTTTFTATTPGAVSYNWDFGDGSTANIANPTHTYTAYGSYDVTLIITNSSGCSDTLKKPAFIKVQKPTIGIPGFPTRGCLPFDQNFKAIINSVVPITSYLWDFGDGTTSTQVSPNHTYTSQGSYTIKLIITSAGGCTDTAIVKNAVVLGTKPKANFTANPRDVCAKQQITFTDLSTGGADQWFWTFGDGGTSTNQNPNYAYNDTGYFNVTLVIWHNGCADTIKFNNYIHIKPPIANFDVINDCDFRLTKSFTDKSVGADTWAWNFGDGSTSNAKNPVHTYAAPGTYLVSLTVTNLSTGCDHTKAINVPVIWEKPDFNESDSTVCKGSPVSFNAINVNPANISSYQWDFGDGTSGSGASVSHVYTVTGKYDIKLIIADLLGCKDTVTKPKYITVYGPTAFFSPSANSICLNSGVTFKDSSQTDGVHPIMQWIWDYGDGTIDTSASGSVMHVYAANGSYTVTLKVKDSNGCIDSIVKPAVVLISHPTASFISDTISCTIGTINFTDQSSGNNITYLWNFGDGVTSNTNSPTHQYLVQGTFTPTLTVTDQYGCTDVMTKPNSILIANAKADFAMSDSFTTCPPLIVNFTNKSKSYTTITWDFGDGTTSSLTDPTHFYTNVGVYDVVVSITGPGGCTDTKTKRITVRGPRGTFTYNNLIGCNPHTSDFHATTKDNLKFIWDFNDGTTIPSPDSVISHTYTNPGAYVPKMILVDTTGCKVPVQGPDTIHVYGVTAKFVSNGKTFCDSGVVSFTEGSLSNDLINNYAWNFGDGSTSNVQNPSHTYNTPGIYQTKLVVTTLNGCKDSLKLPSPIKIVTSPKIAINGPLGACTPATILFNGTISVPDTSVIKWNWNFANGNVSTLQNPPAQVYPVAGTYAVHATGTNSTGCVGSADFSVEAYPIPNVVTNADSILCKGQSVNLNVTGAISYSWTPATALSCNNCASPVSTTVNNITYVVTGTSQFGCKAKDTVSLTIRQPFKMTVSRGDTICKGKIVNLGATGANSYIWSPSAGLSNTLTDKPTAQPDVTTKYMVVGTDDRGCFKDTGYVPIKVWPIPTVEAGEDRTINVGQSLDIDPKISQDVTSVNWSPTTGNFRFHFPSISVKPVQTTEYTVQVKNGGGCMAQDHVTVYVICNGANVFIPNTFSPNGDGMNDQFYLRGTGLFTVRSFRVYNRWGELVFEKSNVTPNDPSMGWDGTYKGVKLTPDVFVYTAEVWCENNIPMVFKGNIALVR